VEIFDFHGNGIGHARNVVDAKPKIKNHPSLMGGFLFVHFLLINELASSNGRGQYLKGYYQIMGCRDKKGIIMPTAGFSIPF